MLVVFFYINIEQFKNEQCFYPVKSENQLWVQYELTGLF